MQLFPFLDTPDNGGEYKVWLTPYDALDPTAPGNRHGFVPSDSKTDTLGAHNVKYSEYTPAVLAFHEAHVEAAEAGLHKITVTDQVGCEIDDVHYAGQTFLPDSGPST